MSSELPSSWEEIMRAVGPVPEVAYECAHVYPLSAPRFRHAPGLVRPGSDGRPLQVYIHVPFCNYACKFCFYYKQVGIAVDRQDEYLAALENESKWIPSGATISQIYVGGGTPTALAPKRLARLLDCVLSRTLRSSTAALTVECSPESLSTEHLEVLSQRGVNRISIGVDTTDADILKSIGRGH